jgi:hypothetical protein
MPVLEGTSKTCILEFPWTKTPNPVYEMEPSANTPWAPQQPHSSPRLSVQLSSTNYTGSPVSSLSRPTVTDLLCSMLEDQSIQHLISWSSTNESFVMSPSTEFSKVLA